MLPAAGGLLASQDCKPIVGGIIGQECRMAVRAVELVENERRPTEAFRR
jgi:hypothetical protein